MPRATSRSLCAGWRACWKGLSAIQRSRTNQEPALVRMGSGQEETERKTHQDWRLFASDNGILVGGWCFHRVSPYWLGLHQHHRSVLVVWTCLGFFAWPSRVCSRSQPHCALHRCNGHATWKLGSEIPVSHTAACQTWSLKLEGPLLLCQSLISSTSAPVHFHGPYHNLSSWRCEFFTWFLLLGRIQCQGGSSRLR